MSPMQATCIGFILGNVSPVLISTRCYTLLVESKWKMARSLRIKLCEQCSQSALVLFRVQYDESGEWIFVCEQCWAIVSQDNPFYVYGGTWKAHKRKK
jgi:hypothetical protein